jgi:hypothetical protein
MLTVAFIVEESLESLVLRNFVIFSVWWIDLCTPILQIVDIIYCISLLLMAGFKSRKKSESGRLFTLYFTFHKFLTL